MPALPEISVSTAAELAACCEHLSSCSIFGFDTEFIGENTYHPHLCLVQVGAPDRLYILDPLALGALEPFWNLVADPARVVVVHAAREEIRMCRLWSGRTPGNLFDIQVAAGLIGAGYPVGHGNLVQQVLGIQLEKAETLTDWARRPLTREQVRYAYDDVRFLLPLYEHVQGRLEVLGRLDWAAEEFQSLTRRSLQDDPESEPWRKLKGLGSLDRRRLATVRELFQWREEKAAQINRPARVVFRDDLIVEVARRLPHRDRDLAVLRGMPRHSIGEILEAVKRGRETPQDMLPIKTERENDPPQVGLITSFLQAVLGGMCARQSLAPALVATTNDVKLLVRHRLQGVPPPADCTLTSGWRAKHILPILLDLLDGQHAVRIADITDPAPFEHVSGKK